MSSAVIRINNGPGRVERFSAYFGDDNHIYELKKAIKSETRSSVKLLRFKDIAAKSLAGFEHAYIVYEFVPGSTLEDFDEFCEQNAEFVKRATLVLSFPGMEYKGTSTEEISKEIDIFLKDHWKKYRDDALTDNITAITGFISKKDSASFAQLTGTKWMNVGSGDLYPNTRTTIFCPQLVKEIVDGRNIYERSRIILSISAMIIIAGLALSAYGIYCLLFGNGNWIPLVYGVALCGAGGLNTWYGLGTGWQRDHRIR